MSQLPDERDLFRRLGDDTHRAHLPEPEALRRRSDRRTTVRTAVGTVAAAVAVLAVIVGANGLTGSATPEQDPANTGPASPTVSETIHSSPPPEAIPNAAWLGKGDLGFESAGVDVVEAPQLCGTPLVATQLIVSGAIASSGSRQGNYHSPDTPEINTPDGTITQSILLSGDVAVADDLMGDIQALVADCPEETTADPGDISYTLADPALPTSSARPDRHILIDVSTSYESIFGAPPDAGPDRIHTYVSVLQVGDVVTMLELRGWEASTTDLEDVQRLAHLATLRLLDWRG